MELRTVLHIVKKGHLTGGVHLLTDMFVDKGRDESGELQLSLGTILHKVLIGIALQTANSLVGTTQLDTQHLTTTKQVTVLISQRGGCAQIASCIRTFRLETQRRGLVGLQLDMTIQRVSIRHLIECDIRVFHSLQTSEVVVCVLQTRSGIRTASMQMCALAKYMLTEMHLTVRYVSTAECDVSHPETCVWRIFLVRLLVERQTQR